MLSNLSATLEAAGSSLKHAVKITTFLTDPRLAEYNEVYSEIFGDELPARTTVMVAGGEFAIEVQCIAAVPGAGSHGRDPQNCERSGHGAGPGPVFPGRGRQRLRLHLGSDPRGAAAWQDQPEDFGGKVRQTLDNLESVLIEAGSGLDLVAKVTTYLTDPDQLDEYNGIYADFFGSMPAGTHLVLRRHLGYCARDRVYCGRCPQIQGPPRIRPAPRVPRTRWRQS